MGSAMKAVPFKNAKNEVELYQYTESLPTIKSVEPGSIRHERRLPFECGVSA
jgi:hypothetical protein